MKFHIQILAEFKNIFKRLCFICLTPMMNRVIQYFIGES